MNLLQNVFEITNITKFIEFEDQVYIDKLLVLLMYL